MEKAGVTAQVEATSAPKSFDTAEALLADTSREWWGMEQKERDAFQLRVAAARFCDLKEKVSQLDKLAKLQGIDEITSFDDLAPLLFQHTVYKSYPIGLLEKGRYDLLTKWLAGLTVHDLSSVDVSGCSSIDSWLDALEEQSPLRPNHSSGTSGKISVIPRDSSDLATFNRVYAHSRDAIDGSESDFASLRDDNDSVPMVFPSYRSGRAAPNRALAAMIEYFGDKAEPLALYDERFSADVSVLAGRVQSAEQKGTLDQLEIAPALLEQFRRIYNEEARKDATARFLDKVQSRCRGRRVYMLAPATMLYSWMKTLQDRGVKELFAPGSCIQTGGGTKGSALPDSWKDEISEFFGSKVAEGFGMSELISAAPGCEHGKYHFLPFNVIFVLDPETGQPLPRGETQTGRLAAFDLLASSYWGGFITGDRVTVGWDDCPCGRKGPYLEPDIKRFSELEGGDDKISCAGSGDAHAAALDYLVALADIS
jgi:hypothetical protein